MTRSATVCILFLVSAPAWADDKEDATLAYNEAQALRTTTSLDRIDQANAWDDADVEYAKLLDDYNALPAGQLKTSVGICLNNASAWRNSSSVALVAAKGEIDKATNVLLFAQAALVAEDWKSTMTLCNGSNGYCSTAGQAIEEAKDAIGNWQQAMQEASELLK